MTRQSVSWLAWSVWALCLGMSLLGLALFILNGSAARFIDGSVGVDLAVAVTFPAVGAFIAARRPGNAIGWLLCGIGLSEAVAVFTSEYAVYTLETQPGALPAGLPMAWLSTWTWLPGVVLSATLLLLLFPEGRLPSPRWRPVAWLSVALLVVGSATLSIVPWDRLGNFTSHVNPLGLDDADNLLTVLAAGTFALGAVCAVSCLAAVILRFRRARGVERLQLKWFTFAGALFVATLLVQGDVASVVQLVVYPLLPVAVGIAILRHRLYDIDVIINRTLVYGLLTAALAAVYFGGVVVLQALFRAIAGQESDLAIVAATLAVAIAFQPLRFRIQVVIDRRFFRRKYDSALVLSAFGASLRDDGTMESVSGDLLRAVQDTVQPVHVDLWLRRDAAGILEAVRLGSGDRA